MELALIWLIVFALYLRTIKYLYVIDDAVKRTGYMYEVPLTAPPIDFFMTRPSVMYRLFMIGMHCVNSTVIYLLWGFAPALLFAVHPMGVWGTAWVTGNYYATAAYFTLISYYIIHQFPNVWGALVAMPIFTAALNSTVCPINFPFLFLFTGPAWGLVMFFPLVMYFRGKKFKTGIKIRESINNMKVVRSGEVKVNYFRRLAVMVKIMAKYTFASLYPDRLGFFDNTGHALKENKDVWNKWHSFNKDFWVSLAVCVSVFIAGYLISPVGIFWYFVLMSIHSQFNLMGQFYAQRYIYLPLVGLCVVVGTALSAFPIALAVVATILVVRTHCFIPAWKDMRAVWTNDMEAFPYSPFVYNNLAQHILQTPGNTLPSSMMNYIAYLLFKSNEMKPNFWEIEMNIACFYARLGQLQGALEYTQRAIRNLEPLGGNRVPLDMLKNQEIELTRIINEQQRSATLSLQESPAGEKAGRENG